MRHNRWMPIEYFSKATSNQVDSRRQACRDSPRWPPSPPPTSTFPHVFPHFCVFNRLFVTRATLEGDRTPLDPRPSPSSPLLSSSMLSAALLPYFFPFLSFFLSVVSLPAISRQAAGAGAGAASRNSGGHKSLAVDDNRKYILFW